MTGPGSYVWAREATQFDLYMDNKFESIKSIKDLKRELKDLVAGSVYNDIETSFNKRNIPDNLSVKIKHVGKANDYEFHVSGETAVLSVVDVQKGKFKVNDVELVLDAETSFSSLLSSVEKKISKPNKSALVQFMPRAEAAWTAPVVAVILGGALVYVSKDWIIEFFEKGIIKEFKSSRGPELLDLDCDEGKFNRAMYYDRENSAVMVVKAKKDSSNGFTQFSVGSERPTSPGEMKGMYQKYPEDEHVFKGKIQYVKKEKFIFPKFDYADTPEGEISKHSTNLVICCKYEECAGSAQKLIKNAWQNLESSEGGKAAQ